MQDPISDNPFNPLTYFIFAVLGLYPFNVKKTFLALVYFLVVDHVAVIRSKNIRSILGIT